MIRNENDADELHYDLRIDAAGAVELPEAVRRRFGLQEGDQLELAIQPHGAFLLTLRDGAAMSARGMYKNLAVPGVSAADELIAQRREEARREEAEWQRS